MENKTQISPPMTRDELVLKILGSELYSVSYRIWR